MRPEHLFGKAYQFAGARNFKAFLSLREPEPLRLMKHARRQVAGRFALHCTGAQGKFNKLPQG